jgi:hypothetical protein
MIDSSAWVDYFDGQKTVQTDWLDVAAGNTPLLCENLLKLMRVENV